MSTSENRAGDGLVLTVDKGQAFWFLDTLTINKVGDQETRRAFSILDHRCPAGFTPPPHIHRGTDEAFSSSGVMNRPRSAFSRAT